MTSVPLPLLDSTGLKRGTLVVSELPGGPRLSTGDPIALLEGQRYRYELHDVGDVAQIEPAELFDPDDATRLRGRINPGQSVGTLIVVVRSAGSAPVSAAIEVVPTKLAQVDEYRQMLSDITTHAAEAVLQGFAPTTLEASISNDSA